MAYSEEFLERYNQPKIENMCVGFSGVDPTPIQSRVEIVDNYTTTATGKALDAVKGKDLNERVTTLENADTIEVVNNYTTTTTGKALDAVKGKDLNERVTVLENADTIEIVNNLNTTTSGKALDAVQGKELNDRLTAVEIYHNAGAHNSVYRGKQLTFNSALSEAIRSGAFAGTYEGVYYDVFPGDYFTFSNIPYSYEDENGEIQNATYSGIMRVADLDYYLKAGNTVLSAHHAVIVPDRSMFSALMNDTNTTVGGYVDSKMRTKYLARAEAIFKACFGADHLLSYRDGLVNAVTDGKPSAIIWSDCKVELMDERQAYGSLIFDSGNSDGVSITNRYSVSCKQFNLFRHRPDMISNRQWFFLRNVVSAARFALVADTGGCHRADASTPGGGVRPFALVA